MYPTHLRQRGWLLAIVAAVAVLMIGPAVYAQEPPSLPKISDIVVLGNKRINRDSIIASSGLKVGDPVDKAALDAAAKRLMDTGNFGAHNLDNPEQAVKIRADITGQEAKVVIEVDENDVVQGINITGSGPLPAADIRNLIRTKVGFVLNTNILSGDINRIQQYYASKGYEAAVTRDIGLSKEGILDIPIQVLKVNKITINGLKKTRPFVVTREMKLKPGSYFNYEQLRRDITNVTNTDLFESVDQAFTFPPDKPGTVDIILNVVEKRTGSIAVGVGYSSRQHLVGFADIGESNLFGRGQQVNVRWEAGGLANRNSIELGFTEPWLDKRHTSLSLDLFDKTVYRFGTSISSITGGPTAGTSTDYFETHTGGQVTLSRPFGETYRGFASLRYDDVRVPLLDLNAVDASVLQNGPLAVFGFRVTHNTRDSDIDPAMGGYEILTNDIGHANLRPVTVNGVEAPGAVSGILNYDKVAIDARRYFSPQARRQPGKRNEKKIVFAFRLMFGTSTGILPFSEQYFVGGAESLRGYNEDRFWGSNMFLGSFEYRQPLANALTGVIFTDVGDAWGGKYENVKFSGFTQHSGFSPSVGIGLGLRVVTPIGPIRIDEGFGREGAHTHFSIGHVF